MEHSIKRTEHRGYSDLKQAPVSCNLQFKDSTVKAAVVNYHYLGACLRVTVGDRRVLEKDASLDFYLGRQCIKTNIRYRVCWEDLEKTGTFGVQFLENIGSVVERAQRFTIPPRIRPTLVTRDPANPSREIIFTVINISGSGMGVQSSLSNRHLLPGMFMEEVHLKIAGHKDLKLSLTIQNTRRSAEEGVFELGLSVSGEGEVFRKVSSEFLTKYVQRQIGDDSFQELRTEGLLGRQVHNAINYTIVTTEAEYKKVLKLRYEGYGVHGKVQSQMTWKDMGDGLEEEGEVVAGYLNGQLVASAELRFGERHGFRVSESNPEIEKIAKPEECVEVNRLVIHPHLQRTDVVVGMIQRIHSILMTHGERHVLLAATKKLVPFYRGIGAKRVGIAVAHPQLTGVELQIMLLNVKVFLDGSGLNPFAWRVLYEQTDRYLNRLGLIKTPGQSPWLKAVVRFFSPMLTISKKLGLIKGSRKGKKKKEEVSLRDQKIDPKYTQQHIIASVLLPYILEAEDMAGKDCVARILNRLGVPRAYLHNKVKWVSVEFMDDFLEEFSRFGDITELSRRAAFRSMDKDVAGLNYYVLKHLLSPEGVLKSYGRITSKFNRTRTYRVFDLRKGHARLGVGLVERSMLPRHEASCENWKASFEAFLQLMTGRRGQVKKISCCYKGDPECVYDLSWVSSKKNWPYAAFISVSSMVLGWFGYQASLGPLPLWAPVIGVGVTSVSALLGTFWSYFYLRREHFQLREEFEVFKKESDDQYSDLQTSKTILDRQFDEMRLLESTSRGIIRAGGLEEILQSALNAVSSSFGFTRAIVMLVDEEKRFLTTAALSGISDGAERAWQFKVDVQKKRDNPQVVSSVFLSGKSVLVSNVKEHLFQLTEESQALVRELETDGFCIVSIPGNDGTWGVLIADKKDSDAWLGNHDVGLLQRVAQHLGIALDKYARIDRETRLRKLFEKYVPDTVLDSTIESEKPNLGGQMRKVTCMFIDIRGFTALSNLLPPGVTVQLLNRFLTVVQDVVSRTGGVINKFLGDGAFIRWDSSKDCSLSVTTTFDLIRAIHELNQELEKEGLPQLEIGIGVHVGQAIVGNIGSEDRMEYTVIGSAVNLASRLEWLSKKYKTKAVISGDVYETLPEHWKAYWDVLEQVRIRGMDSTMTVAVLKQQIPSHEVSLGDEVA